jgi:hypothetical protein
MQLLHSADTILQLQHLLWGYSFPIASDAHDKSLAGRILSNIALLVCSCAPVALDLNASWLDDLAIGSTRSIAHRYASCGMPEPFLTVRSPLLLMLVVSVGPLLIDND